MKLSTIFVSIVLGLSAFSLLYAAYPSVHVTPSTLIVDTSPSISVGQSTLILVYNSIPLVLSIQTATVGSTEIKTSAVWTCAGSHMECIPVISCDYNLENCYETTECGWISHGCRSQSVTQARTNSYVITSTFSTYTSSTYWSTLTLFSTTDVLTAETQYTTRVIPLYQLYGLNGVQIAVLFVFLAVAFLLCLHYKWNSLHNLQLQGSPKILLSHSHRLRLLASFVPRCYVKD
jgi:hypothetical protein